MNFLAELRETARVCPKPQAARALRAAADMLAANIKALVDNPTQSQMQALNGAWAHAVRVFGSVPPLGGDGVTGGAVQLDEMQKAA